MYFSSLEIARVRNLQALTIPPHPKINFIVGLNGSGKTSILESLSILSIGRSFRTTDISKVITLGSEDLTVFSKGTSDSGKPLSIGISRSSQANTIIRINGETVPKISTLAAINPTVFLDTNSIAFIEGGPEFRRNVLDWGMFHVEHSYLDVFAQYKKICKQKAHLLRSASKQSAMQHQMVHWNRLQGEIGEVIDSKRERYVEALNEQVNKIAKEYFEQSLEIQLSYRSGWNKTKYATLMDCLDANVETETMRQSVLYGPQRGDINIEWSGTAAKDICSRGQKKLVLYWVRLAQVKLLIEQRNSYPLLLVDDLPAELDPVNISRLSGFLADFPCQAFITSINDNSSVAALKNNFENHKMFHVEHGCLI